MPNKGKPARDTGILYLTATPIGNLSDISVRAIETLKDADFIAAEDTRVTRKLTSHFGIKKPLVSYHAHNIHEAGRKILARILSGENCALVTDAGTPGISDPGEELVRLCTQNNISVIAIPGACAAVAALTVSGLPASRFVFEGFLPSVKSKRLTALKLLTGEIRTIVFYESPHKLLRTLKDMLDTFGDRQVSISRELTKIHEETLRMTLCHAVSHFEQNTPRGEFVITVEGATEKKDSAEILTNALSLTNELIGGGMSVSEAVKKAACETGCSKNELYKIIVTSQTG